MLRAKLMQKGHRPSCNAQHSIPSVARANIAAHGRAQNIVRRASGLTPPIVDVAVVTGGGDGAGGTGGSGGGGGGGDDDPPKGDGLDPKIAAILLAASRTASSFPADFSAALLAGKVSPEILTRFIDFEANILAKLVWGVEGFRERLLADPSFFTKLGIEVGIGIVTKVTAEYAKRGDNFTAEIDFVAANVVMAIIADFMLTWLPAPTFSVRPKVATTNALAAFFANCPDNAFQKVPAGMEPFTLVQRGKAILRNGGKLLGVGFCASMLGVGLTNALVAVRMLLDPDFRTPNPPQNILQTSMAYGVYMSISSNLRYQIIAGVVEERGIETLFKGNSQACAVLSFAVRTANTFVGSLLWVDFIRLLGMQSGVKH